MQVHDVQRHDGRERDHQHRRDDGEVFGHIVGDAERRQRAARDQKLFSNFDDFEQAHIVLCLLKDFSIS